MVQVQQISTKGQFLNMMEFSGIMHTLRAMIQGQQVGLILGQFYPSYHQISVKVLQRRQEVGPAGLTAIACIMDERAAIVHLVTASLIQMM